MLYMRTLALWSLVDYQYLCLAFSAAMPQPMGLHVRCHHKAQAFRTESVHVVSNQSIRTTCSLSAQTGRVLQQCHWACSQVQALYPKKTIASFLIC